MTKSAKFDGEEYTFGGFVRACALFGAIFVYAIAILNLADLIVLELGVFDTILHIAKSLVMFYLARFFWHAYKYGKTPFLSH